MNALTLQHGARLEALKGELKLQWILAAFSVATATASIAWDRNATAAFGSPDGWGPRHAILALSAAAQLASRD